MLQNLCASNLVLTVEEMEIKCICLFKLVLWKLEIRKMSSGNAFLNGFGNHYYKTTNETFHVVRKRCLFYLSLAAKVPGGNYWVSSTYVMTLPDRALKVSLPKCLGELWVRYYQTLFVLLCWVHRKGYAVKFTIYML